MALQYPKIPRKLLSAAGKFCAPTMAIGTYMAVATMGKMKRGNLARKGRTICSERENAYVVGALFAAIVCQSRSSRCNLDEALTDHPEGNDDEEELAKPSEWLESNTNESTDGSIPKRVSPGSDTPTERSSSKRSAEDLEDHGRKVQSSEGVEEDGRGRGLVEHVSVEVGAASTP
jgi:hypothetical protein